MRELFVYYRIAAGDAPRCEALVRAFQACLVRDLPGLQARLLARPGTPDGEATWMEIYAGRDVDAALQSRIESAAAALAPLLRGARHAEVFIALG